MNGNTRPTNERMADHSQFFLDALDWIARNSVSGACGIELQDWLDEGDFSDGATLHKLAREWDELNADAREARQSEREELSAVAATLGRKGGSVKSERKARSSAANGRKGGRPPAYDIIDLVFHVPPKNAGQIVEVAYALDADRGNVVRRIYDASDRTTEYHVSRLLNDDEGEYWNGEPSNKVWRRVSVQIDANQEGGA